MTPLSRWLRALPQRGLIVAASVGLAGLPCGAVAQDKPVVDPAVFERLDANQDGVVSGDEVKDEAQGIFQRLLRSADADSDGKLTKAEFEAGLQKRGPASETPGFGDGRRPGAGTNFNPETLFARLDANSDGKLTAEEVPGHLPEPVRVAVKKRLAAKEGADSLTLAEFTQAIREQIRGGRPPRRPGAGDAPNAEMGPPAGARPGGPLMAALDTDKDGELSESELAAAVASLKQLDKNGDGKLTRDEVDPGRGPASPSTPANVAASNDQQVKIFKLQHGDVVSLTKTLDDVLGRTRNQATDPAVRVSFDLRTNSIVAVGPAKDLAIVEAVLKRLDEPTSSAPSANDEPAATPAQEQNDMPAAAEAGRAAGGRFDFGAAGAGGLVAGLMRRADQNADGLISKGEAPERLRDRFDALDADSNGQLDREELTAGVEKLRELFNGAGQPGGRRPVGAPRSLETKPELK